MKKGYFSKHVRVYVVSTSIQNVSRFWYYGLVFVVGFFKKTIQVVGCENVRNFLSPHAFNMSTTLNISNMLNMSNMSNTSNIYDTEHARHRYLSNIIDNVEQ